MRKISQREAHRLRKRVVELERAADAQRRAWAADWPGGVHIISSQYSADGPVSTAIRTARQLKHAVVALSDDSGLVRFMALPLGKS